ncbi:MAG: hypothetical protein WDA00_03700 [Eubacteriales bacterium]
MTRKKRLFSIVLAAAVLLAAAAWVLFAPHALAQIVPTDGITQVQVVGLTISETGTLVETTRTLTAEEQAAFVSRLGEGKCRARYAAIMAHDPCQYTVYYEDGHWVSFDSYTYRRYDKDGAQVRFSKIYLLASFESFLS